jgi:hypothetical protein
MKFKNKGSPCSEPLPPFRSALQLNRSQAADSRRASDLRLAAVRFQ